MYTDYREFPERPELAALMDKVESLGVSCELGLIQRHCTVDPLGLFRFGYTPVDGLVRALNADFEDIGSLDALITWTGENLEYFVKHETYGFEFHSGHFSDEISEADLLDKVAIHFEFLARKLQEDLRAGEKVFVYRSESHGASSEDAMRLSDAMWRFGKPVLLWIALTGDAEKFGTAEWSLPGKIMTGYLDWFADVNYAGAMPFEYWVKAVQSAVALWEAMPEWCETRLNAARGAKADGDYGSAFAIWGDLFVRFPDRPEPYLEAAILLSELERQGDAIALLDLGLTRIPNEPALAAEHRRLSHE